MKKGKFGLSLPLIAMIAFVFTALNQPIALLLVVGYAFLAEKDAWLNRQVIQALLLWVVYAVGLLAIDLVFGLLDSLFTVATIFGAFSIFGTIKALLEAALFITVIVFIILAICKVLKGNDACIPVLYKHAGGDFVKPVKEKPAPAPAQQPPVYQAPPVYQPPVPPAAEPAAPAARFCTNCGKQLSSNSVFCPGCGTRVG